MDDRPENQNRLTDERIAEHASGMSGGFTYKELHYACVELLELRAEKDAKETMRDKFAMAAISGCVMWARDWDSEAAVERAYDIADKMLEERWKYS